MHQGALMKYLVKLPSQDATAPTDSPDTTIKDSPFQDTTAPKKLSRQLSRGLDMTPRFGTSEPLASPTTPSMLLGGTSSAATPTLHDSVASSGSSQQSDQGLEIDFGTYLERCGAKFGAAKFGAAEFGCDSSDVPAAQLTPNPAAQLSEAIGEAGRSLSCQGDRGRSRRAAH